MKITCIAISIILLISIDTKAQEEGFFVGGLGTFTKALKNNNPQNEGNVPSEGSLGIRYRKQWLTLEFYVTFLNSVETLSGSDTSIFTNSILSNSNKGFFWMFKFDLMNYQLFKSNRDTNSTNSKETDPKFYIAGYHEGKLGQNKWVNAIRDVNGVGSVKIDTFSTFNVGLYLFAGFAAGLVIPVKDTSYPKATIEFTCGLTYRGLTGALGERKEILKPILGGEESSFFGMDFGFRGRFAGISCYVLVPVIMNVSPLNKLRVLNNFFVGLSVDNFIKI